MADGDTLSTGTVSGSLADGGAYPEGVTLAELHIGPVSSFLGRSSKVIARVTTVLRGTKYIVHAATGWHLMPSTGNLTAEPGQDIVFRLPHTDQAGWRDSTGADFTGWAYQVTVESRSSGTIETYTKTFQLATGQTGPIELATIPDGDVGEPVSAPTASVTSVFGKVGDITEADLLPAIEAAPPKRIVSRPLVSTSYRAKMPVLGGLTNGVDTGAMTRVRNVAPYRMTQIALGYANVYQSASRETAVPNPITVRAAVEYGGLFFPLYLNGSRDAVIAPGGFAKFEPVFVDIPKGAEYFVRTLVTVDAGGRWPYGVYQGAAYQGDGVEQGTGITDKTTSGTVTTSNNYAYGPSALWARRIDGAPSVIVLGDSTAFGQGDSQDRSMVVRASNDQYPVHNLGYPGAQAKEFIARYAGMRTRLAVEGTHWIVQFGTNDINAAYSAAEVQASLRAVYQLGVDMGCEVWGATLPPRTTSTDAWASTDAQSKATTEAVRVAVNDWIRTTPAPLAGYFEVADELETARNSGIWQAGYTSDGIHPNQTGQAAGATAFDLGALL